MPHTYSRILAGAGLVGALALSPLALSHFDDKEILQSYRQSWFALVTSNVGPMFSMLKGEMPWDQDKLKIWSDQFVQLTRMDISRGFAPGSEKGKTRAKPEIWENRADFDAKMDDMRNAADALKVAVSTGDRGMISEAIQATGGTCKACHDEYKSENYLY